jgi:hypothetical protein
MFLPEIELSGLSWIYAKISQVNNTLGQIVVMIRVLLHPSAQPISGPEFRVYRFNPGGSPNGRSVAFASSEQPGHEARLAFDGTKNFWEAKAAASVDGEFIGYDFGDRSARAVRELRIEWVDSLGTPSVIRVEWSNDGRNWVAAGSFDIVPYTGIPAYRTDTFPLDPAAGSHRFWRVAARRNAMSDRLPWPRFISGRKTRPNSGGGK